MTETEKDCEPHHTTGRLALRIEGDMWNAYWAPEMSSMKGSLLLGSIRLSIVRDNKAVKDSWMRFMQIIFEIIVLETTGLEIKRWTAPKSAPEQERGGSA